MKMTDSHLNHDRAVVLWSTKDWQNKDHKSLRVNIEYDHAVLVRWSPDSKAFIIHKAIENVVEVYKVVKKPDGWIGPATKVLTFPKHYVEDVVGLDIAATGRFIMTCSEKTELVLWDLKGELLTKIDTLTMSTFRARVSPCGRFVSASGFTPDVKVWEVVFTKSGEFDRVLRAFELKGHTSGVYDFGFSADSSRMATVSKDGSWKVFNINIEYNKGEDPHLLVTGKHKSSGQKSHLAMSPDGEVVAIATGSDLSLYLVHCGQLHKTISDIYSGPITSVRFDSSGKYVLTSGDRHVRVFHNMTGYLATVSTCEAKLKQSGLSAATKERLTSLVQDSKAFLASMGESARL